MSESITKNLRLAHINQLYAYIQERERDGWYYGNKKHFEKRHKELETWVLSLYKEADKNQ